jgi:hypothetical protein
MNKNTYKKLYYISFIIIVIIIIIYFLYIIIYNYFHTKFLNSIEKTIVIIRHGEKAYPAKGNLHCKGLNRSLKLPDVLLSRFGTNIKNIYSTKPIYIRDPTDDDDHSWYLRPIITIEPLAIKLQLPINIRFNHENPKELKKLADILYKNSGGVYIVSWEHKTLQKLVEDILDNYKLNKKVEEYENNLFSKMYVIRKFKNGEVTFTIEDENIMFLSNICPS